MNPELIRLRQEIIDLENERSKKQYQATELQNKIEKQRKIVDKQLDDFVQELSEYKDYIVEAHYGEHPTMSFELNNNYKPIHATDFTTTVYYKFIIGVRADKETLSNKCEFIFQSRTTGSEISYKNDKWVLTERTMGKDTFGADRWIKPDCGPEEYKYQQLLYNAQLELLSIKDMVINALETKLINDLGKLRDENKDKLQGIKNDINKKKDTFKQITGQEIEDEEDYDYE